MNSWIVQASPQQFLIDMYLEEYEKTHLSHKDWWLVDKQHKDLIKDEDEVYVWKAASEPSRRQSPVYHDWLDHIGRTDQVSGIIAKGKVVKGLTAVRNYDKDKDDDPQFEKYRVGTVNVSNSDLVIDVVYGSYDNIRAKNILSKQTLLKKLGKSRNTAFSSFMNNSHGRRSVLIERWEADIIKSLF